MHDHQTKKPPEGGFFVFQQVGKRAWLTAWEQEQRRLWLRLQQVQRLGQQQERLAQQRVRVREQEQRLLLFCHKRPMLQRRSRPKRESFSCVFQSE
jgi:hypothetical protein